MSILDWFLNLLRAIWKFFKKFWWLIAIVLLVISIWFPLTWAAISAWITAAWGAIVAFAATHSWWAVAAIAFGILAVIDPKAAAGIIEDVAGIVGDVGGAIIGGVVTGLGSSPLGIVLLALGGFWLFSRFKRKKQEDADKEPAQLRGDVY